VALVLIAAVFLAFVPRLPSADTCKGFGISSSSVCIAGGSRRRLGIFAVTQITVAISSGFFETMGVPILQGRDFDERDRKSAERVVMISQSVARQLFTHGRLINGDLLRKWS